jgi:hypothetical protein
MHMLEAVPGVPSASRATKRRAVAEGGERLHGEPLPHTALAHEHALTGDK